MSIATRVEPNDHVVLFYEHDHVLVGSVCEYLVDGLEGDDVALVVATSDHASAFESTMVRAGIDVAQARSDQRLVILDADETLSRFMVDGWPKSSAFFAAFGGLIRGAADTGRRVRVYGEMVALLWDAGDVAAAIELETLWNDLRELVPFSLLCAYPAHVVSGDDNEASLDHICQCHSEVRGDVPPGTHSDFDLAVDTMERTWPFHCDSRSLSGCRRFVRETLSSWGLEHVADDAVIVASELATNAVLHARTDFTVRLTWHSGALRVSVRDENHAMPIRGNPSPTTVTGRGLLLIDAISRRWGIEVEKGGKSVWAELPA
jgi:anti-sigma regulatory factor (Ser/Thr protein kinase)